jgi:hypothetical protein
MSRHSLIANYGNKEIVQVQDKSITDNFVIHPESHLQEFGFNSTLHDLAEIGLTVKEVAIDLFLIAMSVYAADTRISRKYHAQDEWTREIDIYLPVSNTDLWNQNKQLLSNLLQFLTGDRWTFIFRSRPTEYSTLAHTAKPNLFTEIDNVSLLSGGLDSFIGAINTLKSSQKSLFISHHNDAVTSSVQNYCLDALKEHFGNDSFSNVKSHVGFPKELFDHGYEDTTRSRSFLFYTLAILAASALPDNTKIIVPENGLIALNVPLDTLRLGALSTRTAHPYFIARLNQLVEKLSIKTSIENPYRHQTKGQMIDKCKDKNFLKQHIAMTMSCSDPKKARWQGQSPQHCGYCLPCLIRRASIKHGFDIDETPYGLAFTTDSINSRNVEGIHIRSFQVACHRLQNSPHLAKILIHKPGPLSDTPDEIAKYEKLYQDGMEEVYELVKDIHVEPIG